MKISYLIILTICDIPELCPFHSVSIGLLYFGHVYYSHSYSWMKANRGRSPPQSAYSSYHVCQWYFDTLVRWYVGTNKAPYEPAWLKPSQNSSWLSSIRMDEPGSFWTSFELSQAELKVAWLKLSWAWQFDFCNCLKL